MALVVGTNSYISFADATAYFADQLGTSAWTNASASDRSRSLITASGQITLFVKDDCKLPLTPPIAEPLQQATAQLALAMLADSSIITQGDTSTNTKRVKAGSAEVEFFRAQSGGRFPPQVMNILVAGECIAGATGVGVVGIGGACASGTTTQSTFTNIDEYGLTEGYP